MLSFALAKQLHGTQQEEEEQQPPQRTFSFGAPRRSAFPVVEEETTTTTTTTSSSYDNDDATTNSNKDNTIERGLWIRLLPGHRSTSHEDDDDEDEDGDADDEDDDDDTVQIEQGIPSAQFPHVHPNCNAPAALRDVRVLSGGGSGTAVFHGRHREAGSLVLKHGGARDTLEVFSLVEVASELLLRRRRRRRSSNDDSNSNNYNSNNVRREEKEEAKEGFSCDGGSEEQQLRQQAAEFMRSRIPEFVGLFCSPYHFRDRGQEMWSTIRNPESIKNVVNNANLRPSPCSSRRDGFDHADDDSSSEEEDDDRDEQKHGLDYSAMSRRGQGMGMKRDIRIRRGTRVSLEVTFRNVVLNIPNYEEETHVIRHGGHEFLHQLATELAEEQKINAWKVTLMQKTIGGPNAKNGAVVLTAGNLRGELLDKALAEFTTVIEHLQTLTWPEETAGLESARAEWERLEETKDVTSVTKKTDAYCGSAIRKNFLPEMGRFAKLREFGDDFRGRTLMLERVECFPASFLGLLLKPGANLTDLFLHGEASISALDRMEDSWLDVLQHATCFGSESSAATNCIWTCGLTDAGLHNTFLSLDRGLELFDLGKPQLMPIPAFMTKFLMSFFHALGMEETEEDQVDSDDASGSSSITWVRRFYVLGGKLALTEETQDLLPLVYQAFGKTLDHFVANVFGNDESVRRLLIKYVVLQLLSDGAFCLLRWEEKGGGRERFGKQAKGTLHKWLWRSLWDLYIASDVYEKLLAPH